MIPKFIFLIPYRNRESQKTHFTVYMKYILEDFNESDYEIYFCHQCDNRPFNRGAMKNIGFIAMKNKYPLDYKNITFIFNDIDTIPATKNLLDYDTEINIVKHFYGLEFTLGGIFSIKGSDFEKCGGFPNFWGWGFEDKSILDRVIKNNINICRENFFKVGDQNIIHIMDNPTKLISKKDCWRIDENADGYNDIKDLNYNIVTNNHINIINIKNFLCRYDSRQEELYPQNLIYDKTIKKNKLYSETLTPVKNNPINFKKMF